MKDKKKEFESKFCSKYHAGGVGSGNFYLAFSRDTTPDDLWQWIEDNFVSKEEIVNDVNEVVDQSDLTAQEFKEAFIYLGLKYQDLI